MWVLLACTTPAPIDTSVPSDADTSDTDEPSTDTSTDTSDTSDPCAGVPLLAYTNFGEGFLRENCQGCHAATAPDRHDAPEDVTFDTVEQVWAQVDAILETSTGDDPEMPPQGGVSADDRTRLAWWLQCGIPGT